MIQYVYRSTKGRMYSTSDLDEVEILQFCLQFNVSWFMCHRTFDGKRYFIIYDKTQVGESV